MFLRDFANWVLKNARMETAQLLFPHFPILALRKIQIQLLLFIEIVHEQEAKMDEN